MRDGRGPKHSCPNNAIRELLEEEEEEEDEEEVDEEEDDDEELECEEDDEDASGFVLIQNLFRLLEAAGGE